MDGKPGSWSEVETQLFLSLKTAVIVGLTAAAPICFEAATGYLQGLGGTLGMIGAALGAAGRAIYLRSSDNTGAGSR